MFWHTDNYNLTLEEPQLSALHGKKLKINVRSGELSQLSAHLVCYTALRAFPAMFSQQDGYPVCTWQCIACYVMMQALDASTGLPDWMGQS